MIARPTRRQARNRKLTASVVIPRANEAGNIQSAVERTPELGAEQSSFLWKVIPLITHGRRSNEFNRSFLSDESKFFSNRARGKGNAVREGFAAATGDILFILDADLTMPPEELPKFYEIIVRGQAEFANGCRLVYPMESRAMQFLNLCANKTFGLLFSWMMGQPIKDTLCGTKVLRREHWDKIQRNRAYFGDFDPFGDFDMLFGADKLNLKIADVPIRYRERTYGTTNIQRWRHGLLLLRMMIFAARKLKFV